MWGEPAAGMGAMSERLARACQRLERERSEAPSLVAELLAAPASSQPCRIAVDPRFQSWGLAALLLGRGEEHLAAGAPARAADAAEAAEAGRLARLALAIAGQLFGRHPAPVVQDLRARAWAGVGEAALAGGDLAAAADALRSAAACLGHGTGDLLVDARLLEFEAAVRAAQGRPGDALALLRQAAARYRKLNEPAPLARVLARREELQGRGSLPGTVLHLAFEPHG